MAVPPSGSLRLESRRDRMGSTTGMCSISRPWSETVRTRPRRLTLPLMKWTGISATAPNLLVWCREKRKTEKQRAEVSQLSDAKYFFLNGVDINIYVYFIYNACFLFLSFFTHLFYFIASFYCMFTRGEKNNRFFDASRFSLEQICLDADKLIIEKNNNKK